MRISEAPSYGQTVLTYQPGSAGAVSYLKAAQEIAHRGVRRTNERRTERRGLGRGWVSCSSARTTPRRRTSPSIAEGRRPHSARQVRTSPTSRTRISPNPRQPRTVFDEEAMEELVDSIREVGLLQPVVVRPLGARVRTGDGGAPLAGGTAAGMDTIPAIVRETEDHDLLRDALLENLHRAQLNPLEEAAAYQQMLEDFGCTQEELQSDQASRPQISNTIRLLRLPATVQRRVAAGVLSAGHARALLAIEDPGAQESLAQRVVAEGLSVRAVEELVTLGETGQDSTASQRSRSSSRRGRGSGCSAVRPPRDPGAGRIWEGEGQDHHRVRHDRGLDRIVALIGYEQTSPNRRIDWTSSALSPSISTKRLQRSAGSGATFRPQRRASPDVLGGRPLGDERQERNRAGSAIRISRFQLHFARRPRSTAVISRSM